MFQSLLVTHIIAGSLCLILGLMAMFSRKKRQGKHALFGSIYHWLYVVVFVTSVIMAIVNWAESYYLFFIAIFSYGWAVFGYLAVKKKWKNWLRSHIIGMLGSYIGIVTAVLVTNGQYMILLNKIPPILMWFLPTIIGTPFIIFVVNKYSNTKKIIS